MIIDKENQRGFTLIEILMVTAIIGILTAIAVARFADYHDRARQGSVLHDLRICLIETAIEIQEKIPPSHCYISEHENLPRAWSKDRNVELITQPAAQFVHKSWLRIIFPARECGGQYQHPGFIADIIVHACTITAVGLCFQ